MLKDVWETDEREAAHCQLVNHSEDLAPTWVDPISALLHPDCLTHPWNRRKAVGTRARDSPLLSADTSTIAQTCSWNGEADSRKRREHVDSRRQ